LYGKVPQTDHLKKSLKERKFFDSGDYALSKAGKGSSVDTGAVGSQHPLPENIPHLSSPGVHGAPGGAGNGNVISQPGSGSPVKENRPLHRNSVLGEPVEADEKRESGEYFDSGDYALSKAGTGSSVDMGSPTKENQGLHGNSPHLATAGKPVAAAETQADENRKSGNLAAN
jgi:hypothetical protein